MELDQLDRRMAGLRTALAAVSANLVEVETNTDRIRLDHAALTGVTQARWSEASQALSALWQWFSQLNDVMERATQLRGGKAKLDLERRRELETLVTGPSIEVATTDIPLSQRGLLGPATSSVHSSPDDLLAAMVAAFDQAKAVITSCGEAWASLEPRLAGLDERRAGADRLAAALGERHRPELVQLGTELDALGRQVASDPLSVDPQAMAPLDASLRALEGDLQGMVILRDSLAQRLSEARAQLQELRLAAAAGVDAHREVLDKIAAPQVPDPIAVPASLETQLNQATAAAGRGEWRSARHLMDRWARAADDLLAEAQRVLAANRAPIAARNELRGRLDAYRAKAYRSGRLEDPTLAALYGQAHEALYTAPTDLVAAADTVGRYQQALAGPTRRGVPS